GTVLCLEVRPLWTRARSTEPRVSVLPVHDRCTGCTRIQCSIASFLVGPVYRQYTGTVWSWMRARSLEPRVVYYTYRKYSTCSNSSISPDQYIIPFHTDLLIVYWLLELILYQPPFVPGTLGMFR
ncbi:unnamed protein product, partial [Laminaria digitata]